MEKKKYISLNQRIINQLAEHGFKKKNKYTFVRIIGEDIVQSIVFGHSTQGRKHIKYYAIHVVIELPRALSTAKEMGIYTLTCFENINLGYLLEKGTYLEWLIGEDTNEKYDNEVINSMLYHIEKYAMPFFDKYNVPSSIVNGIKNRAYPDRYGTDEMIACIALLLYGSKEDFLWFVKKKSYEKQFLDTESEVDWDYKHPNVTITPLCESFLKNVDRLKPIIEAKGIEW